MTPSARSIRRVAWPLAFSLFAVAIATASAAQPSPENSVADRDFEVPESYVGPLIEDPAHVEKLEPGFEVLDWFDPKGPPALQFAEEFGVDAEQATDLLRWQASLVDYVEDLRSLPSYGHELIVNPSPGSVGGLVIYLKEPMAEETTFVSTIPVPPGGENVVIASALTRAEARALALAEEQRLLQIHGPDAYVVTTVDWESGVVTAELAEEPLMEFEIGCAMSTQTGGYTQGGRAASWVPPNNCGTTSGTLTSCTSAFAIYFNGKQGILTAGHCLVGGFGIPRSQHFVSDTVEGLEVRCINECSSMSAGYYNGNPGSGWSRSRAYAALRPYYNDNEPDKDDYAVWRERYASTVPSGKIYVVPGGPNSLAGLGNGGYYAISRYVDDGSFPSWGTWVCQAAQQFSTNGGGLYCGNISANPSNVLFPLTDRGVDVTYSSAAGNGPRGGSSGGPWFYANRGLGIHVGSYPVTGGRIAYFERIEPIFDELDAADSTITRLYCDISGSLSTCYPW